MQDRDVCPYCRQPLSRCRCRRRAADIALWVVIFLAGTLVFAGCGLRGEGEEGGVNSPTTVSSSGSDNEATIVSETSRFARQLGVKVTGWLTEYEYVVPGKCDGKPCLAAGWYVGTYTNDGKGSGRGTAYYYRPYVLNMGRVVDGAYWETVTNTAGHEVCHAETGAAHDHRHWGCMARVARPTYPDPGSGVSDQAGIGLIACAGADQGIIQR